MKHLKKGKYFVDDKWVNNLDHLVVTEAKCKNTSIDWHYHQNSYFSYSLEGHCIEKSKRKTYAVKPGTLLFHNWQDAHCNTNHSEYSRNFYVELEKEWFVDRNINQSKIEGSMQIENPFLKYLYHQIYLETRLKDDSFNISVESLLCNVFELLNDSTKVNNSVTPIWVNKVKEIIHDQFLDKLTLEYLSKEANVHPSHLSREFPRYFKSTLGNYIRKVKIEHSITLLKVRDSLTNVAYECGFADQSHFIRCFKASYNMTPNTFKKILASR